MRKIAEIEKEIKRLQDEFIFGNSVKKDANEKQKRKAERRAEFLTKCLYALEHNPTRDFIESQLAQVKNKLNIIDSGYMPWLENTPGTNALKNAKGAYETEMGKKKVVAQIRTLEYILN